MPCRWYAGQPTLVSRADYGRRQGMRLLDRRRCWVPVPCRVNVEAALPSLSPLIAANERGQTRTGGSFHGGCSARQDVEAEHATQLSKPLGAPERDSSPAMVPGSLLPMCRALRTDDVRDAASEQRPYSVADRFVTSAVSRPTGDCCRQSSWGPM